MIKKWIVVSIFVGMGAVCLLGFAQEAKASCSKWGDWVAAECDDWATCEVTDPAGYKYYADVYLDDPSPNGTFCYHWKITRSNGVSSSCNYTGIDVEVWWLAMDIPAGEYVVVTKQYENTTCSSNNNPLAEGFMEYPMGLAAMYFRIGYGC